MGCNCKKKAEEVQVTNVTIVQVIETPEGDIIIPQTKEDYLNDELRKWNGGQT
jgi:hypothetical protein